MIKHNYEFLYEKYVIVQGFPQRMKLQRRLRIYATCFLISMISCNWKFVSFLIINKFLELSGPIFFVGTHINPRENLWPIKIFKLCRHKIFEIYQ